MSKRPTCIDCGQTDSLNTQHDGKTLKCWACGAAHDVVPNGTSDIAAQLAVARMPGELLRLHGDVARLRRERDRMRLERDLLATNEAALRDGTLFVVMGDDGNVAEVAWKANTAGSDTAVELPKWHDPESEAPGA